MRNDETRMTVASAAASANDDLWRRARQAQLSAEAEQDWPYDPDCRYQAASPSHRCVDSFGRPVRPHGSCHYEARAQLQDQQRRRRAMEHAEDQAAIAKAQRDFAVVADFDVIESSKRRHPSYPACLADGAEA